MKRFAFRLERMLEWRRSRMEEEQRALERLLGERARLEAQSARLEAALEAAQRSVCEGAARGQALDGDSLVALEHFRRSVRTEQRRLAERRAETERAVSQQQARLVAARRDLRLLEKLRARALLAWERDYAKELEALASEFHLARWPGCGA